MSTAYNAQEIESKWQAYWDQQRVYAVDESAPADKTYYVLEMFPYPSGRIHMGHVRNYTIGDVMARYKRMQGYAVLHPMGWDAFGMPAENAAIQHKSHPAQWTQDNINTMRTQLKRMGFSYDWGRELATCDPKYYCWEQRFFIQMWERGLVYQKDSEVNWCGACATVLANEQVVNGLCWRCDGAVSKKKLKQWFFKITNYAEELLEGLKTLANGWPERVLTMQREWIGRSKGANVRFKVSDREEVIEIFTTRPDTLFGTTFMSLAPEHPLVDRLILGRPQAAGVQAFVARMAILTADQRAALDKEGVFTGAYCVNPLTNRKIPIFVANFVLMGYGTGAVMAVPAHDQRDFSFAQKYSLPIVVVVNKPGGLLEAARMSQAYEDPGVLINSGQFNGMTSDVAKVAITDYLKRKKLGSHQVQYRLRDWGISRQRYWGTPIPMIHCEACGVVPVPDEELPVVLPRDVELTGTAGSPLARHEGFMQAICPRCGGGARRETDTMDTFVESSWYFLRYTDAQNSESALDAEKVRYWCPIDQYIGGIEHAVLHLLYARFFTKVLRDLGYFELDEPFTRLLTQGMVIKDGAKMSKSKGNVVDPNHIIEKYGADTARLFMLFAAPPERDLEWSDQGIEGGARFLNRVWSLVQQTLTVSWSGNKSNPELKVWVHKTTKKVTQDLERDLHFNTAIAAIMEFVNFLHRIGPESGLHDEFKLALHCLVKLLSPFVPFIAEELGAQLGIQGGVERQKWPSYDDDVLVPQKITFVIQVNGKLRAQLEVEPGTSEAVLVPLARTDAKVDAHLANKIIVKTIFVPNRLVNFVVR